MRVVVCGGGGGGVGVVVCSVAPIMQMPEMPTPCPYRIIDDTGGAFVMGVVGGGVWHFGKGFRNSPKGTKWKGATSNMRLRAPTIGGNFAVWGLLFATCDCTIAHDSINAIASGALTGGLLAARAGGRAIFRNAIVGGVLLAAIEGLSVAAQRWMSPADPMGQAPIPAPKTSASSLGMKVGKGSSLAMDSALKPAEEIDDYSFDEEADFDREELFH